MNKKHFQTSISMIPLLALIVMLAVSISIFGSDSIMGASQVALLFASGICALLAITLFKIPWKEMEDEVASSVRDVTPAIVILFLIGSISGTWTASGIIPTFIYYGVKIINPHVFLLSACVICCAISLMIGSSWTTIATIGVALLGIGKAEGFSDGIIAGAIISGAYFGDKISPLSDTTVMASSMTGTPLFTHIKYMLLTTVPSITITLIIFTVLGFSHSQMDASQIAVFTDTLNTKFNISPWLMIVPVLTIYMIAKKMPAIIVLALSALFAGVAALVFQPQIITEIAGQMLYNGASEGVKTYSHAKIMFTGFVRTFYDMINLSTGVPEIDKLVSTRGMIGMLNTVFLIIVAMCFGGCMKASGMIKHIAALLVHLTKTRTGLVASTVATGFFLNGTVSDQYLSIIMTSNFFKDIYIKKGYESRLLSRSIEDSSTVTSPLFPWSSCGMTQATILSVPTMVYAPYCFFNIISPLMSIFVALIGYKIVKPHPQDDSVTQEAPVQ